MRDDMFSRIEEYFHVLHLGEKSQGLGKILSTDTSIKILETVYNSDEGVGLSAPEISELLGMGRTTVIYHLSRMQESGLVRVNPVLDHDANWKKFWDLYRKKGIDISKEQFDRLHNARMNGVKLFVPTKKGFLVMPSTDVKAGQAIVEEALASLTAPVMKREDRQMAKSASLLGILGLLFIAFSFLLPGLSFLQYSESVGAPVFMEKAMQAPLPMTSSPAATTAPSSESQIEEVDLAAVPPTATMAPSTSRVAVGGGIGGGEGMGHSEEVVPADADTLPPATMPHSEPTAKESIHIPSKEVVSTPTVQPVVRPEARTPDRVASVSRAFSYAGTLLLGSVLGFLVYAYTRRR